jgi:isocitrate/isopropylmalate dehydrogenase
LVADCIERAVASVITQGLRTPDIAADSGSAEGITIVGTTEMGDAVISALDSQ